MKLFLQYLQTNTYLNAMICLVIVVYFVKNRSEKLSKLSRSVFVLMTRHLFSMVLDLITYMCHLSPFF